MKPPFWLLRRWDDFGCLPWWAMRFWPRLHWCLDLDGDLVIGDKTSYFCDCVKWPAAWVKERDDIWERQSREDPPF